MVEVNNKCDIINSKTIEKEIIKLKGELDILTKLGNDYIKLPGEIADWMSGVTLIRDDFFGDHTKSVAANYLESMDLDEWPLSFVDWEKAAIALQKDYLSIDFDGVTYWVKK